jgi:uncharacterized surface protein with fasciclin (FAS1) repeats
MTTTLKHLFKGSLFLAFIIFFTSCSQFEEQTIPQNETTLKSIPEVLKSMTKSDASPDLNARKSAGNSYATFNAALGKTGLAPVFSRNDLTVFAPNDAAFAELGLNPGNIGDVEGLTNILLYHVVPGSLFSTDLMEGFVPTVQGSAVEISLSSGPMVNDANIILVDKQARNGVIHGIDAVLFPPMMDIMELVDGNPDFNILKMAIDAAGVRNLLANTDGLTVFAPNNDAFAALLVELGYADLNALVTAIGQDGLISVLSYHVFAGGRVYSSDLMDGGITMFSGDEVIVDTSGPKLIDLAARESMIIATDIQATNGVVHVIDTVILNL